MEAEPEMWILCLRFTKEAPLPSPPQASKALAKQEWDGKETKASQNPVSAPLQGALESKLYPRADGTGREVGFAVSTSHWPRALGQRLTAKGTSQALLGLCVCGVTWFRVC